MHGGQWGELDSGHNKAGQKWSARMLSKLISDKKGDIGGKVRTFAPYK